MNYALNGKKQFISEMKSELLRLMPVIGKVRNVGSFFYMEVEKTDFNLREISQKLKLEKDETFSIFVNCRQFGGSAQLVGKEEFIRRARQCFGGRTEFQFRWEADGYVSAEDMITMLF